MISGPESRPYGLEILAALVIFVAGGCGGESAEEGGAPADVETEGELIPVRGDPARGTYQLLDWSEGGGGIRVAVTRRDGTSGTSYARREMDCGDMRHRYLGEGDTRTEAEDD